MLSDKEGKSVITYSKDRNILKYDYENKYVK